MLKCILSVLMALSFVLTSVAQASSLKIEDCQNVEVHQSHDEHDHSESEITSHENTILDSSDPTAHAGCECSKDCLSCHHSFSMILKDLVSVHLFSGFQNPFSQKTYHVVPSPFLDGPFQPPRV